MFDLYAHLSGQAPQPASRTPRDLACWFIDSCAVRFGEAEKEQDERERQRKNEARRRYMKAAVQCGQLVIPSDLSFDITFGALPDAAWIGLEIQFTLQSPWYSKDDRPFHVLDNPVRKDRVFGVPYMSAASWKGLLRWACRMQAGLQEHLQRHRGKMDDWSDPDWIIHLFGNEKREREDFRQGSLAFYPTWFDKVGFAVINPHSRKTRAGTQPIFYEVVPADTEGVLHLLYAPLPRADGFGSAERIDALRKLLDAAEQLLTVYGFSAKRTAGWGLAEVTGAKANGGGGEPENPIQKLKDRLPALLGSKVEKA